MTNLSGIFTVSGEKDHENDVAAILLSLSGEPFDGIQRWSDQWVDLIQATYHTSSGPFQNSSLYHEAVKLAIAGDIRLDNREELFSKLSVPDYNRPAMADAELVLLAYRQWKDGCAEHLLGDYIFVIWNQENREFFCCNDHFGNRSLYYHHDGNRFIFSTHIHRITAISGIDTSPNFDRFAHYVDWSVHSAQHEESWFKNIFQMLPATTLVINAGGIKTRRYWEPQLGEELRFKDDGEYREAFQEVFFKAVSCRMRSEFPVTALLSGGLDSSSIVSVAAKMLEKQNRELHVFSAVLPDEHDPVLKDERYYIDLFRSFPNVKIHYSAPAGKGFLSDLDQLEHTMASPKMASSHFLTRDFIKQAESLHARVILDGVFGELGATNNGNGFYAERLRKSEWGLLWKELKDRKALTGKSIAYQLRTEVIKPFIPHFLTDLYTKRNKVDLNINGYHCFQPAFADSLRKRAVVMKADKQLISLHIGPDQRINQLAIIKAKQNRAFSNTEFGPVEFRTPFTDKRLIEFCLNTPSHLKVRTGYKRSLVRIGLNGILPPEIQWRNTKCPFSADYMRRYNAQVEQARQFLDGIQNNDPVRTVIDVEKMQRYARIPIDDNEKDLFKSQLATHHLPKAIYFIYFLRQFKDFQQQP